MDDRPAHIVDQLIGERAPGLMRDPLGGPLLRRVLFPLLGYREAKAAIDRVQGLDGRAIMDFAAAVVGMRIGVRGVALLPARGRVVIASNHPTGLADGVVLWRALSPVRRDLRMLANADAIRIAPTLAEVFVPVPWRAAQRSAADRRRVVAEVGRALRGEGALVFFPSGRLAYCTSGGLAERPWQPTVVAVARKFAAPILPVHIRARNSRLFYLLSRLSDEMRDITLFHELLNKRSVIFELTLGRLIDPHGLPDDPGPAAALLQRHVEHDLPRATASEPELVARCPGER
ncbi:MAG: 1-acyl-sn-glycerol-3-phosphate acyltransferase [Geminicoccaceae bacterium]